MMTESIFMLQLPNNKMFTVFLSKINMINYYYLVKFNHNDLITKWSDQRATVTQVEL